MKRMTLFLAAVFAVGSAASASAQAPASAEARRTIAVEGEAELRVPPDEVVLTLGVETFDASLQAAKAANDERVAAILAAARARGVPDERVRTDFLQVEPRYDTRSMRLVTVGHVVRKTIVVSLRELGAFDALLGDAVAAGATHVHGVDFRVTELRAHRDRARALALDAAREKAQAMAARLGQRLGAPITISEQRDWWASGYRMGWGARQDGTMQNVVVNADGEGAGEGTLAPGQISVKGRVSVLFELLP
jgi:uncharacterized protein